MRFQPVQLALVVALLVAAAALLNPSAEQHRTRIREAVAERSQLAALLRLGDLAAFASEYHSWGVASYTTDNAEVMSLGAFGIVVVLDSPEQK